LVVAAGFASDHPAIFLAQAHHAKYLLLLADCLAALLEAKQVLTAFLFAAPLLLQVKIGDFGFTKRLKRSKETVKVARITHPRWVAPEVGSHKAPRTAADCCQALGHALLLTVPGAAAFVR
jgi:hypothetical protein